MAEIGEWPRDLSLVPDEHFYEVVDGRIVVQPPKGVYEADIITALLFSLSRATEARRRGRVIAYCLFQLDRAGKQQRRPDVAFVSAEKWPLGKRLPRTEAWDIIPDLAVEVVSESNSATEIAQKVVDYFRAGVRQVWVVYPDPRQVYVYSDSTSARILTAPAELDGGDLIPGFRLSLTELFGDEPTPEDAAPAS